MSQVLDFAVSGNYDVVAVDEGQFFEDITDCADELANRGITVIIAGLDANFLNHPTSRHFPNMVELFPKAEMVTKLKAVCATCLTACCASSTYVVLRCSLSWSTAHTQGVGCY